MNNEPLYFVTMVARSGSSMMMEALHKGGMDALYDPKMDAEAPWGFYELPIVIGPDFYEKYKGKVSKILLTQIEALPEGNYRAIFMKRNPHDILRSMEKLTQTRWGDEYHMAEHGYFGWTDMKIAEMRAKGIEVIEIEYDDVLRDPIGVFAMLKEQGWPIDPDKAASVVDTSRLKK